MNGLLDQLYKDPAAVGQVLGAIIGVVGLFIGTFITIFTTWLMRKHDLKREDKNQVFVLEKDKKEKEFNLKQVIYSEFLSELAHLEKFITKISDHSDLKSMTNFDEAWNRVEIKVDLVAGVEVRKIKDTLQDELMAFAEKRFKGKPMELSDEYLDNRQNLLDAIRKDINIFA